MNTMNKIFKFFCACLTICLASTALIGCSEDNDPSYLSSIQLSSSYITIGQNGGSVTTTVKATSDWAFVEQQWTDSLKAATPEWLTVSQTSGTAGETELTFSAEKATESHEIELLISCGDEVQRVKVVQQAEYTEPVVYSVAEAVAMIKAGTQGERAVRVKGIVCRIQEISVQYGNATYFISDDGTYGNGNWLEMYRGYWINSAKFTKGDEFAVGDELVISGVLIDYNGTPETNQGTCEVISIKKSLIGIASVEMLGMEEGEGVTEFPLEGGQVRINVNSKGNGFHVSIPQEAKSWLHIADFGADYVTLEADANAGGDRTVTVGLSTVANGTTYACEQSFSQKGAIIAATVADFLAAEVGTTQYRMTGVVTELYTSDKQGKSFYIQDYSGKTLVYRAEGFIEAGAKVGDIVTVVGQRGAYKDSPQMVSGTFEELKYAVTTVTIEEFLAKEDNKEVYYMVTGTVKDLLNDKGQENDYGNMHITDGDNELYVYGCYPGYGATGDNRKGLVASANIEVGDQITIIGTKGSYNGVAQLAYGIYFHHEKPELVAK